MQKRYVLAGSLSFLLTIALEIAILVTRSDINDTVGKDCTVIKTLTDARRFSICGDIYDIRKFVRVNGTWRPTISGINLRRKDLNEICTSLNTASSGT